MNRRRAGAFLLGAIVAAGVWLGSVAAGARPGAAAGAEEGSTAADVSGAAGAGAGTSSSSTTTTTSSTSTTVVPAPPEPADDPAQRSVQDAMAARTFGDLFALRDAGAFAAPARQAGAEPAGIVAAGAPAPPSSMGAPVIGLGSPDPGARPPAGSSGGAGVASAHLPAARATRPPAGHLPATAGPVVAPIGLGGPAGALPTGSPAGVPDVAWIAASAHALLVALEVLTRAFAAPDATVMVAGSDGLIPVHAGGGVAPGAVEVLTNPTRGPPQLTLVSSGTASATGNDSVTDVTQINIIVVNREGSYHVHQQAGITNEGEAVAISDGHSLATGNTSSTHVTQINIVSVNAPATVGLAQEATVTNTGTARATAGAGDATAVGNAATTTVDQVNVVAVSRDGQVDIDQQATVANRGDAVATSSGGNATAVGNASQTTVNQVSIAGGRAPVTLRQSTEVANEGTAGAASSAPAVP